MLPRIDRFLASVPPCLHDLVLKDFSDAEITNWTLSKKYGLSIVVVAAMRNNFAGVYQELKCEPVRELRLVESVREIA